MHGGAKASAWSSQCIHLVKPNAGIAVNPVISSLSYHLYIKSHIHLTKRFRYGVNQVIELHAMMAESC